MKYKNFNTQPQIKSFVLFVKSDGHAASLTVHVRLLKKCVDALDVSPAKENHKIYHLPVKSYHWCSADCQHYLALLLQLEIIVYFSRHYSRFISPISTPLLNHPILHFFVLRIDNHQTMVKVDFEINSFFSFVFKSTIEN